MKIICPQCGFTGTFAATTPTQAQHEAGQVSRPVDLLDTPGYIDAELGDLAVCSGCGDALVFAGWMHIGPELMSELSEHGQKQIRDGQEAVRRLKKARQAQERHDRDPGQARRWEKGREA